MNKSGAHRDANTSYIIEIAETGQGSVMAQYLWRINVSGHERKLAIVKKLKCLIPKRLLKRLQWQTSTLQ